MLHPSPTLSSILWLQANQLPWGLSVLAWEVADPPF